MVVYIGRLRIAGGALALGAILSPYLMVRDAAALQLRENYPLHIGDTLRASQRESKADLEEIRQRLIPQPERDPTSGLEEVPQPTVEHLETWVKAVSPQDLVYGWLWQLPEGDRKEVLQAVIRAYPAFGGHMRWAVQRMLSQREAAKQAVSEKADRSPVTAVDQEINRVFNRLALGLFPGAAIWGEEESRIVAGARIVFFRDPIDGTSNYVGDSDHYLSTLSMTWVGPEGTLRPVLSIIVAPEYSYAGKKGIWWVAGLGIDGILVNGTPLPPRVEDRSLQSVTTYVSLLEGSERYRRSLQSVRPRYREIVEREAKAVKRGVDSMGLYELPLGIRDPNFPSVHLHGVAPLWDIVPPWHMTVALKGKVTGVDGTSFQPTQALLDAGHDALSPVLLLSIFPQAAEELLKKLEEETSGLEEVLREGGVKQIAPVFQDPPDFSALDELREKVKALPDSARGLLLESIEKIQQAPTPGERWLALDEWIRRLNEVVLIPKGYITVLNLNFPFETGRLSSRKGIELSSLSFRYEAIEWWELEGVRIPLAYLRRFPAPFQEKEGFYAPGGIVLNLQGQGKWLQVIEESIADVQKIVAQRKHSDDPVRDRLEAVLLRFHQHLPSPLEKAWYRLLWVRKEELRHFQMFRRMTHQLVQLAVTGGDLSKEQMETLQGFQPDSVSSAYLGLLAAGFQGSWNAFVGNLALRFSSEMAALLERLQASQKEGELAVALHDTLWLAWRYLAQVHEMARKGEAAGTPSVNRIASWSMIRMLKSMLEGDRQFQIVLESKAVLQFNLAEAQGALFRLSPEKMNELASKIWNQEFRPDAAPSVNPVRQVYPDAPEGVEALLDRMAKVVVSAAGLKEVSLDRFRQVTVGQGRYGVVFAEPEGLAIGVTWKFATRRGDGKPLARRFVVRDEGQEQALKDLGVSSEEIVRAWEFGGDVEKAIAEAEGQLRREVDVVLPPVRGTSPGLATLKDSIRQLAALLEARDYDADLAAEITERILGRILSRSL